MVREMIVTVALTTRLDALLAPFEARSATVSESGAERRRECLHFGWELNRLQGGVRSPAGARLEALYVDGRVSKNEYLVLAAKLASQGLLAQAR